MDKLNKIDMAVFVLWVVILFCMILIICLAWAKNHTCYNVEIEFTDGTKRTIQFKSEERPKVTRDGCVYDYSKKSWICGCRDIQYMECN